MTFFIFNCILLRFLVLDLYSNLILLKHENLVLAKGEQGKSPKGASTAT